MKHFFLILLFACLCEAQLATLANFNGTNGASPTAAPLLLDSSGNLWGMTSSGGANNAGTVYEIPAGGSLTTIYNFCSLANCADGSTPMGGLIVGPDGNFWGTTSLGGAKKCGTLFEITSAGVLTTLHSFCQTSTDGANPGGTPLTTTNEKYGPLVYLSTYAGGAYGTGAMWEYLVNKKEFKVDASFDDESTSSKNPVGSLELDRFIFGIASAGGLDAAGAFYSIDGDEFVGGHSFCQLANCADGSNPGPYLSPAASGYAGVTQGGGANQEGTIFVYRPFTSAKETFETLYNFCSQADCGDGSVPVGGVTENSSTGAIYGTTSQGGANAAGILYQLSPKKVLTTLYSFCSLAACADGENPSGSLIYDSVNGVLYGTTQTGGSVGVGTVYSFSVP